MAFRVLVDDNSHYQDESERYEHGVFDTYAEALRACKAIVDRCLGHQLSGSDSKSAAELYSSYTMFGDDPFICPAPSTETFSAWEYAEKRCKEICSGESERRPKPEGKCENRE